MRRLNVKLLVILVVGSAFGAAAIQGLHAFQVHRQSGVFLREADRAEKSGHPQEAADFLRRYLLLVPGDSQAMARLAKHLSDHRQFSEALTLLGQVVQRDPQNDDARRRLVDISIRRGRYQDAWYQLDEFLLKSHPDDADLHLQLGTCQQELGKYPKAAQSFETAIDKNPALIAAYEQLAQLRADRLGEGKAAVELLNQMVARNPARNDAYIVRGRFRQSHVGDPLVRTAILTSAERPESNQKQVPDSEQKQVELTLSRAFDDAKRALDLAPSDSRALIFAAEAALAIGSANDARKFAQQASKQDPSNPGGYRVLASLDFRENRPKEAADWLTRGVQATEGDAVLLWTLANLRIETNDIQEAKKLVDRLRPSEEARPFVQYLSARILIADSKWAEASHKLEGVGSDLKRWPQLHKQLQFWLAQCYARLGRDDLSAGAYRAALEMDPVWTQARFGLAEELRALGRIDDAMTEFQRLRQLPDAPPQISTTLLRLDVLRNLSKPPEERAWTPIEDKLRDLLKHQPAAEIILLAAEVRVAEGKVDDASQMLRTAMIAHPKESSLWSGLTSLASQYEHWDECERVLGEMQGRFGDGVAFRLAKAEYLMRRLGASGKDALRALADPPSTLSASDRSNLALGMARAAFAIQDYEQAQRLWRIAADADPSSLPVRLLLFDIAWRTGQPDAMKKALAEVEAMEGDGPISHYGEALQWAILAKQKKDNSLLTNAERELAEARARRPNWSKIALLAAQINELRGQTAQAAENYLAAIDLGERDIGVISRLLNLLLDQKDYSRAELVIRKLQHEQSPFSAGLTRLVYAESVRTKDYGLALMLARKSATDSNNVRDRIRLAQLLQISGRISDAESEFRKATDGAPKDITAWVALIQFYATTDQKLLAQKAILEAKTRVDAKQASVELAYAYQLVGQMADAENEYDAAAKASPQDDRILRQFIEFKFRNGKSKEAETRLREIIGADGKAKSPQIVAWARRSLALWLATSKAYPKYVEAQALIKENLRNSHSSEIDRRAQAFVDAAFPSRENNRKAIAELETLAKQPGVLVLEDRFLLAKLYLSGGEWAKASQILRQISAQSQSPAYLVTYVENLLNHKEAMLDDKQFAEADDLLRHYEERAPREFVAVELRAQLFARQHRYGEAFDRIVNFLKTTSVDAKASASWRRSASARLEEFGNELTALKRNDEARRFYEQAEAYLKGHGTDQAEPSPDHVRFLLRRARNEDAIQEFNRLAEHGATADVDSACAALSVVRTVDPQVLDRVERSIVQVAKKRPTCTVWVSLAAMQGRMGRFDDEEESYRRALSLDGTRVDALNNLAYLLALRKKDLPEAFSLVERSLAQAGPHAAIRDTRAVVELSAGQPNAALADSTSAVSDDPNCAHIFHQARAQLMMGQVEAARASIKRAVALGLTAANLHPLEAPAYRALEAQAASR